MSKVEKVEPTDRKSLDTTGAQNTAWRTRAPGKPVWEGECSLQERLETANFLMRCPHDYVKISDGRKLGIQRWSPTADYRGVEEFNLIDNPVVRIEIEGHVWRDTEVLIQTDEFDEAAKIPREALDLGDGRKLIIHEWHPSWTVDEMSRFMLRGIIIRAEDF